MSTLEILQFPDKRLYQKAELVKDFKDKKIQKIIDDMFCTLYQTENCAGLSATQLNIERPPSITVIAITPQNSKDLCLINPTILTSEGETCEEEGCMSVFPDQLKAKVKRAAKITLKAFDRDGNVLNMMVDGFLAKCIQHEVDHLNGILYIDRVSSLKRALLNKKMAKLTKASHK